jgi:hypothetical protein
MKSANATDAPTAPLEAAGRLAAGTVLGRYVLERRLGAGGFGVVWLAYDEKLERQVAVKAIPREGTGSSLGDGERSATVAEREARVAARLNHPGIVALYELAADEYHVYLVSELVEGRTLAELAGAGALADRDVARVGIALCDALAHAHERGVIHRDVKPQNVMVVAEPAAGAGFAKLADFGVAHLAGGDPLTRTGDVVGTLAYMAPEQADGERVSPASDVYSLALTLYEAWAGVNPVRGKGAAATARRVGRRLPSLSARRRDLPAELAQVVDAALDPRPERRPALGALRRVLARAEADLSGEGGLVEAETRERFGLTAARRPFFRRGHRIGRDPLDAGVEIGLPPGLARIAAGAGSALLVLAALERLGPDPPLSPAVAAVVAGALVALLPRAGWLLFVGALCAWLASPAAGREGTALVLLVVLGVTPLLLPRSGDLWSVPALGRARPPVRRGGRARLGCMAPGGPRGRRPPLAGRRGGAHRPQPSLRHRRRNARA